MASQRKPDPGEPEAKAPEPEDERPIVAAEYLDETPRTYHWPDGPQTAELGDVCALPDGWDNDGRWRVAKLVITRLRDNHPEQAAKTSARQTQARDELHARLAEEAKGGEQR